ncbi:MAG: hypothetical protein DMG23_01825, partial [Acidobacteria bacterium]
ALLSTIIDTPEPGAGELCHALEQGLLDAGAGAGPAVVTRLKSRVWRLRVGPVGQARSVVLKRLDPWLGRRNELVARRWLPAIGLGDRCPHLLATVADRRGQWVWHVYEDLGDGALEPSYPDHRRVAAVVDLIAELHTRAARHALLPECRHYCGGLGAPFFAANVRDAIAVLEGLAPPRVEPTPEQCALRDRLLDRLSRLQAELSRRVQMLEALGGPDTLLHGDLWTTNALVATTADGFTARLIDWDHAAVGPVSYDVSTFLYRFPRPERPWILEAYRSAVGRAGWHLPPTHHLNALFETAEYARYANRVIWHGVALARGRALLGVHAVRPRAAAAGVRRLLARAVPPRKRPRSRRARHGDVLPADGAVRVGRAGSPVHAGRRRGRADRVRRSDSGRGGRRTEACGSDAELSLRHRPTNARLRAPHGPRGHRPGAHTTLDQHRTTPRPLPRCLFHDRRNRGDTGRTVS